MRDNNFSFDVDATAFQQRVVENSYQAPVLVDFWAPWCGPCKSLMPLLTRLCAEYDGLVLLAKVNIDEEQALAQQFAVRSVPTVKLFRNGQVVDEFMGALPEAQIRAFIEPYIVRESDRLIGTAEELFAAGRHADAFALLTPAEQGSPPNLHATLSRVEMLIALEQFDEATALLQTLPANAATEPEARALAARLGFAAIAREGGDWLRLEQLLAADPSASEARYRLAARAIVLGDFETAMAQLLELMRRDRRYGDDAGRKGLLKVIEILGGEGELVSRLRGQMFNLLH